MPYITRDDGERFIIPSYRDVLSAKKQSLLRREVLLLSQNYGDYITLQRKNINQYEVAFSPDPGYLLGETVWHYFKRPFDLIYCEIIPNTFEAILVIVKSGIVYLDGSFPIDSIVDELVVFRTQQNHFDIYIYGDVPISETLEEGKFALDSSSVKSFNILEEPVFPTLPIVKAFQLLLVDSVLKSRGIGVLPLKGLIGLALGIVTLLGAAWWWLGTEKTVQLQQVFIPVSNPYQAYLAELSSPDPAEELRWIANNINLLMTIPGWIADEYKYSKDRLSVSVRSLGARSGVLYEWATKNRMTVEVTSSGYFISASTGFRIRATPQTIADVDKVVSVMSDSLSYIINGNALEVGEKIKRESYYERLIAIDFSEISTATLDIIAQQLRNLPLTLTKVSIKINNGNLTGSITLKALGSSDNGSRKPS